MIRTATLLMVLSPAFVAWTPAGAAPSPGEGNARPVLAAKGGKAASHVSRPGAFRILIYGDWDLDLRKDVFGELNWRTLSGCWRSDKENVEVWIVSFDPKGKPNLTLES